MSSFFKTVKSKVNATLQNASGSCCKCGKSENVYCGECKERNMVKSSNARLPKKLAWCCKKSTCQDKGRVESAPASAPRPAARPAPHQNKQPSKPASSAELDKARRVTTKMQGPPCTLCGKNVHSSELQRGADDKPFHTHCLVCFGCKKVLSGGDQFKILEGHMLCDSSRASCYRKITEPKAEKKAHRLSTGEDVSSVGVHGIIEMMGAELEAALDGMVPRCEVCGSTFGAKQSVVIIGACKKHKECMVAGKPVFARDMTPKQAARLVPDLITIRIFVNSKWFTFFYVRSDPGENMLSVESDDYVEMRFIVDPSARSPPTRQCPPPEDGQETIIDCEGVGDSADFVLRGELAYEGGDDTLTAHITHAKYALVHDFAVRMLYDSMSSYLLVKDATLAIQYPAEEEEVPAPEDDHDAYSVDSGDEAAAVPVETSEPEPQPLPVDPAAAAQPEPEATAASEPNGHAAEYDHAHGNDEEAELPAGATTLSEKTKKKRRQFKSAA